MSVIGKVFSNLHRSVPNLEAILAGFSSAFYMTFTSVADGGISLANIIITWGTAFIVGYGVIRILFNMLWLLLLGKRFEWKVGILDKLVNKVRVVKVQKYAYMTDDEIESNALLLADRIMKRKRRKDGGVKKMGIWKKVLDGVVANKRTIVAVGAVVAGGVLTATGIVDPLAVAQIAEAGLNNPDPLIAATTLGGVAFLGIQGILGQGVETPTQYKERVAVKKEEKAEVKQAKADGTYAAKKTAAKLMKMGFPQETAQQFVGTQLAEAKKAAEQLEAEKLAMIELEKEEKAQKLLKEAQEKEALEFEKKAKKLAAKTGMPLEKAKELLKQ